MNDITALKINEGWADYYEILESIRVSGIVNMYGAAPVLAKLANISGTEAKEILVNWMHNYSELADKYSWR